MATRDKAAASGVIEIRGEREVFLDDVVLEVDVWSGQRKVERDEKTEIGKRQRRAGEEKRDRALNRCTTGKEKSSSTRQMGMENQKRRAAIDLAISKQRNLIIEHVQRRQKWKASV